MLQWNRCYMLNNSPYIYLDVSVNELYYYKDVYLDSIYMDVFEKPEDYVSATPTSKAKLIWQQDPTKVPTKNFIKFVDVDLMTDDFFLIYAIATGEPTEDAPCTGKSKMIIGAAYNRSLLYNNSLKLLNNLGTCEPSKEFIDYILKVKAFELAIKVGDYRKAIEYWNTFFKKEITVTHKCGCNG